MTVPDFQTITRPLLVVLEDGQEPTGTQIREALARSTESHHEASKYSLRKPNRVDLKILAQFDEHQGRRGQAARRIAGACR